MTRDPMTEEPMTDDRAERELREHHQRMTPAPALTLQQWFEDMLRAGFDDPPSPVAASEADRDLYQILHDSFFGGAVTALVKRHDVNRMDAYISEVEAWVGSLKGDSQ